VFELFYQDAQPAAAGNDGLGIGLWLSRQLVELHGGTLAASSEGVGRGSAFTLTLRAAVPLPAEPDGPHGDHATSALRILVVDDNVDAAQALGMLLELEGNEVALAHNGAEAAERAAEFLPEIIFLDVGLPDIDGLEVCRRLRRSAQGRRTTIVALTGWGSAEDMQRTADAGFDGHLTKPVGPESIDHWLARAQSARTPSRAPAAG
jgi:CheY-like chemotaxis protein